MTDNPYAQFVQQDNPYAQFVEQLPPSTSAVSVNYMNKGIAGIPDAVLNTPNTVMNLGKAAAAYIGDKIKPGFASRPEFEPTPNPNIVHGLFESAGFIRPEQEPQTGGQRIASTIAQALPSAMLSPAGSLKQLAGNAVAAGISGGAAGVTKEATDSDTAAIMAGLLAPAAAAKVAAPNVSKQTRLLINEGVNPTIGSALGGMAEAAESKLTSMPILGDFIVAARKRSLGEFNKAAYDRALKKIGLSSDELNIQPGREGVAGVKQALSDAYNDLLPNLTFKADPQFIDEFTNLSGLSKNMMPGEASRFERMMDGYLSRLSPSGGMTGEQFKQLESAMGRDAKSFMKSPDPYQRELGTAVKETQNIFRNTLKRNNPEYADTLKAIDDAYADYAILRDAGSRAGDQTYGFSPSQLAAAVRNADSSVGKGNFATGKSRMQDLADAGVSTLNSKIPDSGTAGRVLMNSLTGAASGALGWFNPSPATIGTMMMGGASTIPYTPYGQKILALMLKQSPQSAPEIAKLMRQQGLLASELTSQEMK